MIDNLNKAERLGWVRSAADWGELRRQRNRMVHEYEQDPQQLADRLNAAHVGVADLTGAATVMVGLAARQGWIPP